MRIAIDGNLGSRVHHFLQKLERDGYCVHYQIPTNTSLMEKYINQKDRYSLGYHLQILQNYLMNKSHPSATTSSIQVYERSPYTYQSVFNEITDVDEENLFRYYSEIYAWKPDIIIYLYCDPQICYERIQTMIGDCAPTLEYLKFTHLEYELTLDNHYCSIPIYKINDQEDEDTVYKSLCEIINLQMKS